MNKFNRTTALILTALLSLSAFSCGSEEQKPNTPDTTTAETSIVETIGVDIPDERYNGYKFRVMASDDEAYASANEVFAETETGDVMNDAVYNRNRKVEERFGLSMEFVPVSGDSLMSTFNQAVLSADDQFDAAVTTTSNISSAVANKYVLPVSQLKYVDIQKPWWNTQLIEASAINGESYFMMGDIGFGWRDATWVLCFNKRLYDLYNFDDIYTMVRDGDWTLDILESQCREITSDLNGDSVIDKDDQWGMLGSKTAGIGLVTSTGITSVRTNSTGSCELALESERNMNALDRIRRFVTNNDLMIRAEDLTGSTDIWTDIINIFREGRALYRISVMRDVVSLRDMNDDFGIIPLPKYDAEQENYYSTYQSWSATGYIVPITIENTDRTSAILEYMSSVSNDTLTNAYYNVTLQGKVVRDDDSSEMLDIIFDSMTSDIGLAYDIGGVRTMISTIINSETDNIASTLASNKESVMSKIQEFEEGARGE